jgi:hypothetical protein
MRRWLALCWHTKLWLEFKRGKRRREKEFTRAETPRKNEKRIDRTAERLSGAISKSQAIHWQSGLRRSAHGPILSFCLCASARENLLLLCG